MIYERVMQMSKNVLVRTCILLVLNTVNQTYLECVCRVYALVYSVYMSANIFVTCKICIFSFGQYSSIQYTCNVCASSRYICIYLHNVNINK